MNNNPEPFSAINYFDGKTVFLTGATGLLGRQIVEKLLHCTNVAKIYILMRGKRNKSIEDRGKEYSQHQLFKFRLNDSLLSKVVVIAGDIGQDDLGMSAGDRQVLTSEVHVMIHSAATVRFNEPLSVAMNLNVRATQRMLDLATQSPNLESFVYVSTAFTHCYDGTLDEEVRMPVLDPEEVLRLMSEQDVQTFDSVTAKQVIGPHPNTYTLTKSFSDHLVMERGKRLNLPIAIAKPAIITGPIREPVPGYCDDLTQAIPAVGIGIGTGITRVIPGHADNHLPVIPVDTVANSIIIIAAKTAAEAGSCDPPAAGIKAYGIFNTSDNIVSQETAFTACYESSTRYPLLKSLRPPVRVTMTRSKTLYRVLIFFYEILFSLLADMMLRVSGKKAIIRRIVGKAHTNILLLSFFLLTDWKVTGVNNDKAFDSLPAKEKEILDIKSMESVDWKEYFEKYYLGVRRYYFGEHGSEDEKRANAHLQRLRYVYNSLLAFILASLAVVTYYSLLCFL